MTYFKQNPLVLRILNTPVRETENPHQGDGNLGRICRQNLESLDKLAAD